MKNTALIELLMTFSAEEIKEFRNFLMSPFFNKRKTVTEFYLMLVKYYPEFESTSLTKEKIFLKLFPGKKYSDGTMRVMIHYLNELAEKYLAHKRFRESTFEFSFLLKNELFDRKQYKLLEKNIIRANGFLDSASLDSEEFYFYKYRLENERAFYMYASNYAHADKVTDKPGWEIVFKDLTSFYILKSMTMYLNILSYHKLYKENLKYDALKKMFSGIDIEEYKNVPDIEMYYYIIKMLTDISDDSHFFKVKDILKKNKNKINKYDVTGAYVNMEAYCLSRIAEGRDNYNHELFEIIKDELDEKTYQMNDGSMSPLFYKKFTDTGLSLNESALVKNFIYKYKPELNKKFRNNYFNYCLAQYEFSMKNYEASLGLIAKIKYDELYIKLNSKILQMQNFYEMNLETSLVAALENFRHFLNNNKMIPADRKVTYLNFHKYLNRIYASRNKNDPDEMRFIMKSLKENKDVIKKNWLIEKTMFNVQC